MKVEKRSAPTFRLRVTLDKEQFATLDRLALFYGGSRQRAFWEALRRGLPKITKEDALREKKRRGA